MKKLQSFWQLRGRSINKLQNDIKLRFVGNLIGDKYWNF